MVGAIWEGKTMAIQFDRLLSVDSAKAEKAVKYGFLNGIH